MEAPNQNFNLNNYSPLEIEEKWQRAWEDANVFQADPEKKGKPFCIVIPPPNVTGSLHMGHAFNTALIDVIVRFQRLYGKNVLCLPGTDHASIAVQTILEKQIKKEGFTKDDIGRDEFLSRAWKWKEESGGHIVSQLKKMGYSVDWGRERFTLDEKLNKAVVEAFVELYKKGLIYRGEYLVNWCPASQSAVSDLEVEMQEVNGKLWYFKYIFIDKTNNESLDYLEVATTRPETLLGDTAVAVNPNDERYKKFIGKEVMVPFMNRTIPVVGDLHVDDHHTSEDIGIALGQAMDQALGNRAGIRRYGHFTLPMDECLVTAAVDLGGRYAFEYQAPIAATKIGTFDTELVEHFWQSFAANSKCNLHVVLHHGRNAHHVSECVFKAVARAVRMATESDPRSNAIPSTKGVL